MKSTECLAASIWFVKPSGGLAPLAKANEKVFKGWEKLRGLKPLPFNDTWNESGLSISEHKNQGIGEKLPSELPISDNRYGDRHKNSSGFTEHCDKKSYFLLYFPRERYVI